MLQNSEPNCGTTPPPSSISRSNGARTSIAAVSLALGVWILVHRASPGLSSGGRPLLVAIALTLAAVIGGAACGNRTALLLAMLLGVPFDLPLTIAIRSEGALLRRKARWLARFLGERPR